MSNVVIQSNASDIIISDNNLRININGQGIPGAGIIPGGLIGQALVKKTNADFDTEWSFPISAAISLTSSVIAGATLSALRVVYNDPTTNKVLYADKDDLSTIKTILGVIIQSGLVDETIQVVTSGQISDSFWSWNMLDDNSLFLGNDGAITQGNDAGLSVVRIGYAINPTTIYVRISDTILTP